MTDQASLDAFRGKLGLSHCTNAVPGVLRQRATASEEAPWRLLGAERGAFETHAGSHAAGEEVALLADHAYNVFLTSAELGEEMARNLADLYNETGLRQISFDGVEGAPEVWAWGLRNPWKIAFDPSSGALWIADVGQNAWEEINTVDRMAAAGGEHVGEPLSTVSVEAMFSEVRARLSSEQAERWGTSTEVEAIQAPQAALVQMVENIARNGFDACDAGPVSLHVSQMEQSVELCFTDEGHGMDEHALRRALRPGGHPARLSVGRARVRDAHGRPRPCVPASHARR